VVDVVMNSGGDDDDRSIKDLTCTLLKHTNQTPTTA
jgi:hypothetical protein